MSPAEFRWTLSPERARVRVCLEGELDLSNVSEIREVVTRECERHPAVLIFDLRELTFLDSSGLGVLVGAKRRLADNKGEVLILTEQSAVLNALSLSGLDRIISVFPSERDLLASLAR